MPFEEALREMEMDIEVLRSHELYERGVYTGVTSEAIEHTDELREILQDVTNRKMPEHWSPYLPRAASGKLTWDARSGTLAGADQRRLRG